MLPATIYSIFKIHVGVRKRDLRYIMKNTYRQPNDGQREYNISE